MRMFHRTSACSLTLWSLLSLWIVLGCLELAEELHVFPEITAEAQEGQDLDEEALLQLASAVRSDVPSLGVPVYASVTVAVTESNFSISTDTVYQLERRVFRGPPSLPLHQQLSVYRI
jgi:hypothetical protein